MWRAVEEVGVGDVLRGLSAWALVWDDVDPDSCGLGARWADGSTILLGSLEMVHRVTHLAVISLASSMT